MEAQSHGWDQQGNPWYTPPVAMTYTTTYTTPNISGDGGGGAFTALLDKKVKEATEAMRMEMDSKLFGKPRGNPELRKCIADAVDQHMPAYADKYKQEYPERGFAEISASALNEYKKAMTESIFRESPLLGALKAEKENAVTDLDIAAKAAVKRKEAKAEAIIDIVGDYFENSDFADGDTVSWAVEFNDSPGKTYHYVAVKGGNNWFITADETRYSTDKIVERITYFALRGFLTSEDFDLT